MVGENVSQPDCLVCQKQVGKLQIPGGAIFQDQWIYAGHAQIPEGQSQAYLGYLMLEPRRHVPGLAQLASDEAKALGDMCRRLSKALMEELEAEHVYAFVLGDKVPHLHIHLVPRYPGAPRAYWGVHVDEWPQAPRGGSREIEDLCQRLRARLARVT